MIIIDENVIDSQRNQLLKWRLSVRQIGFEVGRKSMKDINEILPLLHSIRRPTFFTRDSDFYTKSFRHKKYGLVFLDVKKEQVAEFIRRLLRHPEFNTQAKRIGRIIRVTHSGIQCWQLNVDVEQFFTW